MRTNRTRRIAATAAAAVAASGMAMFSAAPAHAEPAWEDVQTVTEFGTYPYLPDIAVNEKGKAVAVWGQHSGDDNTFRLRASVRPAGGEWSAPKYLSQDGAGIGDHFEVAINDKGQAVAAWTRKVDGNYRMQIRQLSAGNVWGKVRTVSPAGRNASFPAVDIAPGGTAMVGFGLSYGIREVRLAAVKMDGSKNVRTLSKRKAYGLDLDTNRTGETVVVWTENNDGLHAVRSRRLMNGKLTTKATLAKSGGDVSVSVNDGGDAVAAYVRSVNNEPRIMSNAGVSGGKWGPRTTLSTPGTDAANPDTAIAFDGSQAVVWDNELGQVQATFRDLGEAWPASTLIGTGAQTWGAEVVMNDAGDLAIAWSNAEPSVRMLVKPAGETGSYAPPLESDFVVNGLTAHGIDGDGSVVAIHGVQLGESYRLLSRFYNVLL